ncbi:MAG: TIGR03089 family protein [Oryzihumus sp.]
MRTPASLLADLLAADPARPRVTFYDDAEGPTRGERIELSGKVLANWVAKAANALQEELDAGPGTVVRLDLPGHWRALYWALAAWSVGATVDLDGTADADVTVTDDPEHVPAGGEAVVVTLAALARSHPGMLPTGAMDEARELATYADAFSPWEAPGPQDPALLAGGEHKAYDAVVPSPGWAAGARVLSTGDLADVLRTALAAWAVDGSVVLVPEPEPARMPGPLPAAGVTLHPR